MYTLQSYPYDVLSLIFIECLPRDPLSNSASSKLMDLTSISPSQAPILLCHVCSHWRNVALSTPRLWKELNFVASVTKMNGHRVVEDEERERQENALNSTEMSNKETKAVISDKDLAFISFWHRNLSNHVPSLRLGIDPSALGTLVYLTVDLGHGISNHGSTIEATEREKGTLALFNLIQRAEYLDIDHHFSTALRAFSLSPHFRSFTGTNSQYLRLTPSCRKERRIHTQNLHTLIMRQGYKRPHRYIFRDIPFAEVDQALYDSTHSLFFLAARTKIRRLFMEELSILTLSPDISLTPNAKLNAPDGINYASLTHIHTASLHLSLDTWFLLIRSLPSLYAGTFELVIISGVDVFSTPPPAMLPDLKYLAITTFGSMVNVPVLLGLTLPRLEALRINNYPWLTIRKLHQVLESTPNLRELQLGPDHPWCDVSMGMVIPSPPTQPNVNNNSLPLPSPSSSPTIQNTIFNPQMNSNLSIHTSITQLWHIVPHLQYIHFSGSECRAPNSFSTTGAGGRSSRGIVRAVLNSPWLDLSRPQNQIRRIEFGGGRGELWRKQLPQMIDDVYRNQEVMEGVQLVVRPDSAIDLWGRKNSKSSSTREGDQGFGRLGNWFEYSNLGFTV